MTYYEVVGLICRGDGARARRPTWNDESYLDADGLHIGGRRANCALHDTDLFAEDWTIIGASASEAA